MSYVMHGFALQTAAAYGYANPARGRLPLQDRKKIDLVIVFRLFQSIYLALMEVSIELWTDLIGHPELPDELATMGPETHGLMTCRHAAVLAVEGVCEIPQGTKN